MTLAHFVEEYAEFGSAGYIFVEEDTRGRYKSKGIFVVFGPVAATPPPTPGGHDLRAHTLVLRK